MFINQAESQSSGATDQEIVDEMERVIIPLLSRILGAVSDEELPDTPDFLDLRSLNIGYVNDEFRELENPRAEQWAYFLLRERPGFLSLLFLLFFLIIPPVIIFSGFNQIAGDARNKGLRYLLMRTKRSTIFMGKYLGSIMITAALLLILIVSVVLYMHFKLNIYHFPSMLSWGLWGFVAFVLFSLPFISISLTFSALVDSPIGALGSSLGVMALFPIFAFFLKDAWEPLGVIQYVLPFKLGFSLIHFQWWMVATAIAGMVGYAAVYLFLGYLYFRKRDL
jgi:ABC-type transport system involved in multi-copper enzyme maturation permease subunit